MFHSTLPPSAQQGLSHNATRPPLLYLGPQYIMPAPVHNNLGVVTKAMTDLEEAPQALDDRYGPLSPDCMTKREAVKQAVEAAEVLVEQEAAALHQVQGELATVAQMLKEANESIDISDGGKLIRSLPRR